MRICLQSDRLNNNNNNNNNKNKRKKQSNELIMISVDIVPVTSWSHLVSSQGVYVEVIPFSDQNKCTT